MTHDPEPAPSGDATGRIPGQRRAAPGGLLAGTACYLLWGVFPLYFPLMSGADPLEILLHRIVWSLATMIVVVTVLRGWRAVADTWRDPRLAAAFTTASVLIAGNWLIYIYAVNSDHVVEASLGYFINPLMTVLIGVALLRERLRALQWVAMGLGLVAVLVITVGLGRAPWLALGLAATFALYGLVKNRAGAHVDATTSLTVETSALAPVALAVILVQVALGHSTFATLGPAHTWLMVSLGPVTAVPLLLFAAAARRLPLVQIGMLQFVTPVLQFACGVFVFREHMPPTMWVGFCLVWAALVVLTSDGLAQHRRTTAASRAARP